MTDRERIEAAFAQERRELGVPDGFPDEVLAAAAAADAAGPAHGEREDLVDVPFVTIDPPGSRDLDQALHISREGEGYRVRYAIADVGAWVPRGGPLEAEAWRRGLTYYAPDHREPLYPPVLSQEAASLLPDGARPAIVFTLELDAAGALRATRVTPARVRSRAQLTYADALDVALADGAEEAWAESLRLLKTVGELRLRVEAERGGVSLPIRSQHVQQRAALRLGYELAYEEPNAAEEWNAQISLLAGHAAALQMLAAGVGMLRTSPPPEPEQVARVRIAARALGFRWPDETSYADFLHGVDPAHRNLEVLVWQARRLMRGADYVAFQGEPPEQPLHSALAMPYAHCTAPLRRLGDRYVLDLLVALERGQRPSPAEVDTLLRLPPVMDEAERRASRLERRVVDIAEAWTLRGRVGERFQALVLEAGERELDVQLTDPPVRARAARPEGLQAAAGTGVVVRLTGVDVEQGRVELEVDRTG